VNTRFMAHARLDRLLARLARRPERFSADCLHLAAALDARGLDLEVSDPRSWRATSEPERVPVENQFGSEVDGLRTMGREEELRLALRIEFARTRLDRALAELGLGPEERTSGAEHTPAIRRRRLEWHAMRLEMVERNLYLVPINVERYRHTNAERSDLIQAAAAAMFRAVDGFDWRRGVLFRTYAVHWLNQGFRSHLYNSNSTVRVPVYLQKSIKHVNAAIQRLGDPHASVDEIAQESGLRRSLIASARAATRRMRSLDAPIDDLDGTHTLASELALPGSGDPYTVALEDVSIESGIEAALGKLNERERRVVRMRFGIGCEREHIYSEVAAELGVSLERVRQILVRAITKMRTPRLRKMLEPLIG
jgi:RNA polymerase primary sigma factor